jgi:acyl-coenzyme A thioesterase PaaI-like protein
MDLAARVSAIKENYEMCFGCGARNPAGLQIGDFSIERNRVSASFTPQPDHRGFEGVLHGGILATSLDEMMAWTAMLLENVMVVTAKLDLRYRKPAPVPASYRLQGQLDERRGRRLLLSGWCAIDGADGSSTVVAEASGLFLVSREIDL